MRKKILFITPHCSTGGLPQYLYIKISKLIDFYDIYVCMWDDIAPLYNVQRKKICDIIGLSNFFSWEQNTNVSKKIEELTNIIYSLNPDIIHIEEFPEMFLPIEMCMFLYSPKRLYTLIETSHSSSFEPNAKKFLPDVFAFVSNIQEERFRHFRIPTYVVEYPIENYKRPDRDKALGILGLNTSYKHILNVGLFTPGKNQGEVFEIARSMGDSKIQFHFIGNQAGNFEEYWGPLMSNKPDNCIVWGERDDIDKWYAACDLLLFSSKSELNPLVPREALSWHMPVLMYNLPIYKNYFNAYKEVQFLTGNRDIDIQKVRRTLGLSSLLSVRRDLPKVRMVHLLTRPEDEREVASVKSLSPLKELGIDYKQHINEPETVYPENIPPITYHREKKPGYYGAYKAFRRAIEEEFSEDLDYFMICECDCELVIPPEHFIEALIDVCKKVVDINDIYYFSFGATGEGNITWSNKLKKLTEFSFETNKIILAHCILFPQKAREFLLQRYRELSWDSPDIWLNEAFMGSGKKMAILEKPLAIQHEGMSLIDNEVKGIAVQTFEDSMPDKSMESMLHNIYENTSILPQPMLRPIKKESFNYNFINGSFLEVLDSSIIDNSTYKDIEGWFDFEDIYTYIVENCSDNSNFVEIGGWLGRSSCFMATEIRNSGKHISFDVIDTWNGGDENNELHNLAISKGNIYNKFIENMKKAGIKEFIKPIRMDSSEASELYDDDSLDFVFLDGDHSYEETLNNIKLWYPKVKKDGIIAGHDYTSAFPGVVRSVDEYFGDNKTIYTSSWIHRKDGNNPVVIKSNKYLLESIDRDTGDLIYSDKLPANRYISTTKKYYINYLLRVSKDNNILFEHHFDPKGKTVYIALDSKSLGDTIAWVPYVNEFRKKHQCRVICSTFWNELFQNDDITFVKPGTRVNGIYALYVVSYSAPFNPNINKTNPVTIPLQAVAADILGLEYKEIRPYIDSEPKERPMKEKYICISIHSTTQCKYWNYTNGWQKVVNYLTNRGYKVLNISKERNDYMGNKHPKGVIDSTGNKSIEQRINELQHAEMFIGVSSGLSWLAWALNKPTVMISGCTKPFNEPSTVYRVHNSNVCNGCMNDPQYTFDKGKWLWCPTNKNFECSKSITPDDVISEINKALNIEEQRKWNDDNMWSDDGNEWSKGFGGTQALWDTFIYPNISEYLHGNVLEIAPGKGRITEYLIPQCSKLSIVDLNESCINTCKSKFSDTIDYYVNDGKTLPVEDDSLNFVISWDSFVHMHKDVIESYIEQISKKLKYGGYAFIHHSNLIDGQVLSFSNIGGRSNMTAKKFSDICRKYSMDVIKQEYVRMNDTVTDCVTLFHKSSRVQKKIVLLTCLYNAEFYIERCINSIKDQNYSNFHCYIVDDSSTDSSLHKIIRSIDCDDRFSVITNENRMYNTYNYINVINKLEDENIVAIVDGDDYLPDHNVLKRVAEAYSDENTWVTYGSFNQIQNGVISDGWAKEKISFDNLRKEVWSTSHLRTFKVFLFKQIEKEDLTDKEGNYFESCTDVATMFPMLEMAGIHRVKFLPDINYIYNDDNNINIYKVNRQKQVEIDKYIRGRKPYKRI